MSASKSAFEQVDPAEAGWFKQETEAAGTEEELALRATHDLYGSGDATESVKEARARLAEIGNAVYRVVPPRYAAYCKLLHPIFELEGVADRSLSWDEWERLENAVDPPDVGTGDAARDKVLPDLMERSTFWKPVHAQLAEQHDAKRVSWKELADRYGIEYVPELSSRSFFDDSWPRYLAGAKEGDLDTEDRRAMTTALAAGLEQDVFVYFDLLKTGAANGSYKDLVYKGELADLESLLEELELGSPSALWPVDRSWFVWTDWDLEFTLVGGPTELIERLEISAPLEVLRVGSDTRIDYRADQVNR